MSTATGTGIEITRTELNPCTVRLEVVCDESTVREGRKRALKSAGKSMRLPGFRPGQAPAHVIEKSVNPEWLKGATQEETVNIAYRRALKQEEIAPAGKASMERLDFDLEDEKCSFTIKIGLPPQVELGEYKGLEAKLQSLEVSDEEIDHAIEQMRRQEQRREAVTDRGIAVGDIAVLNLKEDGAEGDGRTFMVIAGETFPDLDAALKGMEAEQIKSVELEFPETFQEQDWAGTKKKATLTVRSVAAVTLPEADELAKSHDLEGEAQLRERVKERLKDARDQQAQEMLNEDLLARLIESSKVEVADTTWEGVAERRLNDMRKELEADGHTLEEYAQANNMSEDQLQQKQRDEARLHVKRAVLVERIFQAEAMQIDPREANYHFARIAVENKIPKENLRKFAKDYGPQIRDEIVFRGMFSNVMRFLREHGNITDSQGNPLDLSPKEEPIAEFDPGEALGEEIVATEPTAENGGDDSRHSKGDDE